MATITKKGRELAGLLNPSMGTTRQIQETCSLICRHATTHARMQDILCSGDIGPDFTSYETMGRIAGWARADKWREELMQDAERRTEQLEARITRLVEDLPHVECEPIRVRFDGDPRGYTVKLVMPDGRYNTCGGSEDGIGVPQ